MEPTPEGDLHTASGIAFVRILRELALKPHAQPRIREDWKAIEDWLACAGRELHAADEDRIARAWRAFLSLGRAPSIELEDEFAMYKKLYRAPGIVRAADFPPKPVLKAFVRMIATDDEMIAKGVRDRVRTTKPGASATTLAASSTTPASVDWWSKQSQTVRAWIFSSAVWSLLVLATVFIFEPFGERRWMGGNEYSRTFAIVSIPWIAGLVRHLYLKLVA